MIFVSQQIVSDSFISILEFDILKGFKAREVHLIKSPRPQIVKLIYHNKCGLIIACFRGFIQVYDKVNFQPKWKWENYFKSITAEDNKTKAKEADAKKESAEFENKLADELDKLTNFNGGKNTALSGYISISDNDGTSKPNQTSESRQNEG